jgi:hypothetical protein
MSAEIAKALCEAQAEIGGVQKGSRNEHQKFRYTSIEEMVVATRGPLRKAGLAVLPSAHRIEGSTLVTEWLLLHTSGESLPMRYDMPIVEGKGRPMDKAASASASQALNYLLRDLLLLPRGDREDIDGRDDSGHDPSRRQPSAPPASPVDPFAKALADNGLTVAQWDAWATAEGRTMSGALTDDQRRTAAAWLDGEGSAIVSGWLSRRGDQ